MSLQLRCAMVAAMSLGLLALAACVRPESSDRGVQAAIFQAPRPDNGSAWFAATEGTRTGQGTLASPWDLATALAGGPNQTDVKPGDTIWVRGGTYPGGFTCGLSGKAGSPITVRNYRGERVILDQATAKSTAFSTRPTSSHLWVWGLEFTNSDRARVTEVPGSDPPILRGQWDSAVDLLGSNIKLINCVVHDGGNGIGSFEPCKNSEIYGCLSFNNGWHAPDRGHGHGMYIQNIDTPTEPSRKEIRDCILWNNFGYGLHGYGSAGHLQNIVLDGLISFHNGSPEAAYEGSLLGLQPCIFIGSDKQVSRRIEVRNCALYQPGGYTVSNMVLGFGKVKNEDVTIQDCYVAGGHVALEISRWQAATVTGNTFFARKSARTNHNEYVVSVVPAEPGLPTNYEWNRNSYYAATVEMEGGRRPFFFLGVLDPDWFQTSFLTFRRWQIGTGLDRLSIYNEGAPSVNHILVRPNKYEPGRANIAVYNWQGMSRVNINLASVGLREGQGFEVRSVQNYFGPPVARGVYTLGTPNISIPMTETPGAAPVGYEAYPIRSTLPEFGAFVVLPTAGPLP